ncbi:MAG: hypothetical protein IPN96_04500 [Anaerolineales bacterium]|nr:hypothetical protein [Anaerolineales bacterium]
MIRRNSGGIGAFLQSPIGVALSTNAVWFVVAYLAGIRYSYSYSYLVNLFLLGVDLFVAYYLLDRLIFFFSQFILPIQNPKHRQEIYSRVKNFETNDRGPALFIKNGRVITHEGEEDKHGPGVIVLDTASAAVLRTDTEIRDTVGPGVVFTKSYKHNNEIRNEYIAGSVDLRAQQHFIGPLPTDPSFLKPVLISSTKDDDEMQSRRQQTSGATRDGFDISASISIKFSIKRPLNNEKTISESGVRSQYGFDPEAVRNAITREVIQLGTSEDSKIRLEWNQLPAHLVVNIWREYIRKFKLGDLFISGADSKLSGLQLIEDMINQRVKKEYAESLDDTGTPTQGLMESLEFKQLQSRGLEIMEVRIHNVLFEASIEDQTIQQWSTEWMKIAKKEEDYLKDKETLIETASRDEGSKAFAKIVSKPFSGKATQPQQNPFKTLQLLILPLKEFILNESSANSDMEKELRKLDEIWKWVLDNSSDGIPRAPQRSDKP